MTIRSKVIGCFAAILALFVGISVYNYHRVQEANERLALVNGLFLPLSRHVIQIQTGVQSFAEDVRRFYFQGNHTSEVSTFSRMVRDLYPYLIQKRFVTIEQAISRQENTAVKGTLTEMQAAFSRAKNLFEQLTSTPDRPKFEEVYTSLRSQLEVVSRRLDAECQKITMAAQEESRDHLISSLVLSIVLVLFGILTVVLSYQVLTPLPLLIESLKKSADGDFNQPLKLKTSEKDEIALLAREYNRMLGALIERDTKIQAQQKELVQAERLAAVGQLSAEVVHEIRNPLNAISLNIDWLESEHTNGDPEVKKTLSSISREIERLHQITENYLVRARIPVNEESKAPVNALLSEVLELTRTEAQSHRIAIETDLSLDEIFVRTDRSRLKQAFLNVIKNAKEAMPMGGTLKVKSEKSDNCYMVKISDTGSGMNERTRRNAFQPFFTTKSSGTGLGLLVTKQIVEEASGTLSCDSALGTGTTFTFQFPA